MIQIFRYRKDYSNYPIQPAGIIEDYKDFVFNAARNATGEWSFTCKLTAANFESLKVNRIMYYSKYISGIIQTVSTDVTKKLIYVAGVNWEGTLAWRCSGHFSSATQDKRYQISGNIDLAIPTQITDWLEMAYYYYNNELYPGCYGAPGYETIEETAKLQRLKAYAGAITYPAPSPPISTGKTGVIECDNRDTLTVLREYCNETGITLDMYFDIGIPGDSTAYPKIVFTYKKPARKTITTATGDITDVVITDSYRDYWNCSILGISPVPDIISFEVGSDGYNWRMGHCGYIPNLDDGTIPHNELSPWHYRCKSGMVTTELSQPFEDDGITKGNFKNWWYGGYTQYDGVDGASKKARANAISVLSRHNTHRVEFTYSGREDLELGQPLACRVKTDYCNELINATVDKIQYRIYPAARGEEDVVLKLYTLQQDDN